MVNYSPLGDLKFITGGRRTGLRRFIAPTSIFLLFSTVLLWYFVISDYSGWHQISEDDLAPRLWAQQLLSQPPAAGQDLYSVPKFIHQSWMDIDLPAKMSRWSQTCRYLHQHWEWVLWTDEDNAKMVEDYFPWFLETYRALPAEINRADVSRNMYMYAFGGVYADLDTECLRPFDRLLSKHDVKIKEQSTLQIPSDIPPNTSDTQVALFGRMGYDGTDGTLYHTIPNAWMAATPGHPFFLLVLERLKNELAAIKIDEYGESAEALTGPVALYHAIEEYNAMVENGTSFARHFQDNPSYQLFDRPFADLRMEILPPENIYPYAWNNDGMASRPWCWAGGQDFNSKTCKKKVTTKETYAITYWSHSWSADLHEDRDNANMDKLNQAESRS